MYLFTEFLITFVRHQFSIVKLSLEVPISYNNMNLETIFLEHSLTNNLILISCFDLLKLPFLCEIVKCVVRYVYLVHRTSNSSIPPVKM